MKEYTIVSASTHTLLISCVNVYLFEGWQTTGGVCYDSRRDTYMQALVK
jgi:hypothetical protein